MCLICLEFDRSAMNVAEARRALGEMAVKVGPRHAAEVEKKLEEAEAQAAAAAAAPAVPAAPTP
jgi:hypothetical protein